jgi:hypothetical protein
MVNGGTDALLEYANHYVNGRPLSAQLAYPAFSGENPDPDLLPDHH